MLTIQEAIERFHSELPPEIQAEFSSDDFMAALGKIEEAAQLDLSGVAIYVATGELTFDRVSQYLEEEYGLDRIRAKRIATDLETMVFNPALERIQFLNADPNKKMTLEQEKIVAEKIFRTGLVNELSHKPFIINAVNMRLFYILARDESFKKRLEQTLYENEEMVTSGDITISGEPARSTVGNWLKDYIQRYGSQAYDSVSQSAFINNSDNVKALSPEERQRVADILKTYINIKFFPDSMPSDDGTGWHIIPGGLSKAVADEEDLDRELDDIFKDTPAPAPVSPSATEVPVVSSAPAPVPPAATSGGDSEEALGLKNMLLQYPAGSMERKAIEEEIKRLQK